MTPNRVSALAFRWLISAVFTLCVFAPKAHGQQTSATGTPQPVAGVTVDVKMIDPVDSSSDPAGKQYRAGLIRPVNVGNGVIVAQGSVATLTLARSASGWGVQLSSLVINGQAVPVTSNSSSVIGAAAQSGAANAANAASSALGGLFGKKPNLLPVVAAVATGERVILPPGTSLSFVLNAPAANGPAPANPAQANASALPANQSGRSYYCTFNDTSQRPNTTHYFSGVFQADASQIEVSKAWTNYIRQKYLPGNNRDSGGCQIGTADQQQRVETTLRQTWQVMATGAKRAGMKIPTNMVVDVSWKYVPDHPSASSAAGTPPSTAAASVAPPPTASAATAAKPAAAAAGQTVPAQGRWFYCYNTVPMPPKGFSKQFVSSVFQSDGDTYSISRAWDIYIAKKYAPLNQKELLDPNTFHSPHCSPGLQGTLQDLHDRAVKGKAIEVDWKYTPDQAAPAATAAKPPAAAAAGQGVPAQVQKQQGKGWWWYCTARGNSGRQYMSGVFFYPADATKSTGEEVIVAAWQAHLQKTLPNYVSDNFGSGCTLGGADQAPTQKVHDHMRAGYRGGEVVDIDWKYVPGQDTPPVVSAKGKPYYCFGYNANKSLYFSDTFEVPPNYPANPVIIRFGMFLTEKYGLSMRNGWDGGFACGWGDKAKHNVKPGYKIIETGWKPTSLPQMGN